MKPLACSLAVAALLLAGCGPETGRLRPGPNLPTAVDRIDAMELWAAPPAAVNWDDTPGPDGVQVRLYAFQVRRAEPVLVDGTVEFRMYAGRILAGSDTRPEPFKVWRYSSDDLAVRRFRDRIGWGYATRLGWGGPVPEAPVVTVQATYKPPDGPEVYSAPVSIALPKVQRPGPRRSLLGRTDADSRPPAEAERPIRFQHEVIDASPPGAQHAFVRVMDLDGNGQPDVITGSRRGPFTLIWYENPSWTRHPMAKTAGLQPSAVLMDVNRDGRMDLVAGSAEGISWFEQPADPAEAWPQHLIDDRLKGWRALAAGDVDGDGRSEVVVLTDEGGPLAAYAPPAKPGQEPWPEVARRDIAARTGPGIALAVSDLDGDGVSEVLTASAIYRRTPDGKAWKALPFAGGYALTHLAVADLDGDARPEIFGCEGEKNPGCLVWFKGPAWTPHPLREDLFNPRTLVVTDVDGDRRPDILVAEAGLGQNERPRILLYRNRGTGGFVENPVDRGTPTHNARVADLTGDGRPDIVGAPYGPERHVDLWVNLGE